MEEAGTAAKQERQRRDRGVVTKRQIGALIKQFMRFTMVGVTCFGLDYGIMVLLTEAAGLRYLYSTGISFVIATVINYFLSSRFVYDHRRKSRWDLILFVVLGAIGLGINQWLMWFFVERIGIIYLITKFISGILVSFYNFITRKLLLERHKREEERSELLEAEAVLENEEEDRSRMMEQNNSKKKNTDIPKADQTMASAEEHIADHVNAAAESHFKEMVLKMKTQVLPCILYFGSVAAVAWMRHRYRRNRKKAGQHQR